MVTDPAAGILRWLSRHAYQAITSFAGTTHTQRTHAVAEAERKRVVRLLKAKMEVPDNLPRLVRSISLRTAPVPSGEL